MDACAGASCFAGSEAGVLVVDVPMRAPAQRRRRYVTFG
jgi:hypothetical protein